METPKLDALIEKAGREQVGGLVPVPARAKLFDLVTAHGPALVAALKRVQKEVECHCCYTGIALPSPCVTCEADQILDRLEQEAG